MLRSSCIFTRRFFQPVTGSLWQSTATNGFGSYHIVRPAAVDMTSPRVSPKSRYHPPYSETGVPPPPPQECEIKDQWQIVRMREACKLANYVLAKIKECVAVGVTTEKLDAYAHQLVVDLGAYPSPLNYHQFPKSICTSVNNVAAHGIPDTRPLKDGDLVSVDVTVFRNGFHGDCCATFLVGSVDGPGRELVTAAEECLNRAIDVCRPGQSFSAIGKAVQATANKLQFEVVPSLAGHGIGSYFHGPPDIFHHANGGTGIMEPGMTFTIEPVIAQGSSEIIIMEDGWTATTADDGRAAQFEHTVLVTENGVDVLTA